QRAPVSFTGARRRMRYLLLEPETRLEQELHLVDAGTPHRAARRLVFGLDLLEPAPDFVPVLVEEDDDGDGLVAVVQERVAQIGVRIAEEDAQLAAGHRLADVGDQWRVAVDVAAPVLGEHHAVLDAGDAAEELALLIGQHGLRAIVLGAGPRVAHLGHIVLPRHTGGEALGVQGNHELGHLGVSLLVRGLLRQHYIHQTGPRRPGRRGGAPWRSVAAQRPPARHQSPKSRSPGECPRSVNIAAISLRCWVPWLAAWTSPCQRSSARVSEPSCQRMGAARAASSRPAI